MLTITTTVFPLNKIQTHTSILSIENKLKHGSTKPQMYICYRSLYDLRYYKNKQ